jgi:uncharacterized glyoxalase superfamily protein PhnB
MRSITILALTIGFAALAIVRPAAAHNPDPNDPLEAASPILKVADVDKAMKYYKDVLGFEEEFKAGTPTNYAGVARGKVTFHLSKDAPGGGDTRVYVLLKIGTVDKLHEEFKGKGAQIVEPPTDRSYGMREFLVKTADGQVLIFAAAKQ